MASRVDEAERQVREQRALIERKLGDLEGRVGDDLSQVRSRLQHHLSHAPDLVPGGPTLMEQAERHPFAAMAGGLGIGVAAGMLTGGDNNGRSYEDHRRDRRDDGSAFLGAGMLSMLGSQLISPLRPYVEDAAREVITGFADRQRAARDRAELERTRQAEVAVPAARNGSDES